LLSETNQVEQRVGSVKFKLWFCPRCEHEEVQRSHRWFSGFSDCPECHARTLHRSSDIITQPTRWSTGEELVIHHCANCSYHRESTQILARLPDDDDDNNNSGGFSSFGSSGGGGNSGGSSSGGGASGSW
ncbi:MAG: TPM domain-containing protein, partial [Verrucomicrobiae bacterium]|nr:TPM domain-containing protein [Verrucomicrobiae bacterium]